MDVDGPSGFRYAPMTKFLVPIVGASSALAAVFSLKPAMSLEMAHLTEHKQLWRLFTYHWAFSSIGTSVIGTWLIYRLKIVERRYGSAKYAALVFVTFVASTLIQTSVLFIGSPFGLKSIESGPYAILFSILYQFHKIVPATYQTSILGIQVTDKIYVYAAAIQLLLSNTSASAIPSLCGLVIGKLYYHTKSIQQWRFPAWIRSWTSNYMMPLLSTTKKQSYTQVATPVIQQQDIDTMFAMFPNYSRQDIERALTRAKSDLNRAAEILLSSEPSAGP
ncbi:uncharacterized protein B0P05DRAFT_585203 [Gilbertella persicaria]|uniref:uncharacterized protein n=1 Tax=Gilbertella persicaria TaxID=101096 RepID=UPI0022203797|nr:uncharacterized protein B0P05DRAFT_585203 [Gilbertella persicaria]KAI8086980.1 hypothetical protein B0P05DRAFT_585203 [Gilbertella persicaria]